MRGMDAGPWSSLGGFGWFLGVWVVMMGAMMIPSIAPRVALYPRIANTRAAIEPLLVTGGYLVIWAGVGVLAFAIALAGRALAGNILAWDRAGRWAAGSTLLLAAAYELSPPKAICLARCRSARGFAPRSSRGRYEALQIGIRNGAWCIGCCSALMASLFALGIMNVAWMALVAACIAAEKILPWPRLATHVVGAILLALGLLLLAHPAAIPGLTIPHHGAMAGMAKMGP